MKPSENVTAKNKKKELEKLLQLKTEEIEQHKREQDIGLALERVQEKALAMRDSSDISEATAVFFYELNRLGIEMERCGIVIFNDTPVMEVWSTPLTPKGNRIKKVVTGKLDSRIHPMLQGVYRAWEKGEKYFSYTLRGDEVQKYYETLKQVPEYQFPENKQYPETQIDNCFYFNDGHLFVYTKSPLTHEVKKIFHRFTKLFSLAYTRYLDIKKAEEQAREAQIEAALERVRAKAMAMHSSKDISGATIVIFNELKRLGIHMLRAGVVIFNETDIGEVWSTQLSPKDNKVIDIVTGNLDFTIHPMLHNWYKAWKNKQDYYTYELTGDDIRNYYELLGKQPGYRFPRTKKYPDRQIANSFYLNEVNIFAYTSEPLSDDVKQIFHRFTKVFSHTYKRYLDIVKAEVQAREAQIEASLERVRAKAMAMHSSKDISDATAIVFDELTRLGIEMERCGIVILDETPVMEVWSTLLSPENKKVIDVINGKVNSDIHIMLKEVYKAWIDKKDFFSFTLVGDEVQKYYDKLEKEPGYRFPKITGYPEHQIANCFYFNEGNVFAYTLNQLSEDDKHVFQRFTNVFSLTYRRYQDLIKAEAQAREANKQASINRVRGEIASMRNAEDLKRITPVIWRELKELEVPFFRCGVFIIYEETKKTKAYLSTPEGMALAVLNFKIDENKLIRNIVDFWRKNQVYKEHWNKEDFINWLKSIMKTGQVKSAEEYQGSATAPESLHLHFIPFKQGMLYVGNTNPLSKHELDLVKSLANSFSIAYARYEDFNNLEIAKEQIEKTLDELKTAQAQLIQSEKMASLGELTAGIAHEIQNPLNFVNNFSEICTELIDEMNEELAKADIEEAKAISIDIKQNLKKINHHGKRADAIVKGMLQHSRTSNGVKEPTDINALADEYLRLSYHGLRAKDKSFNAEYKTDFDPNLPKINIVPQDIGRVLLNLINNAFYAVQQTFQKQPEFKPLVVVSTKNTGTHVEIRVKDNGPGIPSELKDKIFQPFFTTKPTGQGTGLGLSLSYDIVKAHGGELKVEILPAEQPWKEGEGTKFTITLPIKLDLETKSHLR
jgi:signal transduction histidine kinase